MILLFIHSSKFSFEVKEKAIERAEDPDPKSFSAENALATFTTVERGDDNEIVEKAISNIIDVALKTKPDNVVIYPYAHLSSNLAEPTEAIKILDEMVQKLKEKNIKVVKAPFGWYKAFSLSCYGHPLSELSRRINKSIEYRKSKEMEVCLKFRSFPPGWAFMRKAVIERVKRDLKAIGVVYGEVNVTGYINLEFTKPEGRELPCVNENPVMIATYRGDGQLNYPSDFSDSENRYWIWKRENGSIKINLGSLLYYLLLTSKEKQTPSLPLWLSPIHVRVLKLTESEEVDKLSLLLKERGIRVQVDDLDEGIGKKIRRAGMDWIPYVAIVGERELQTKNLTVKVRDGSEQKPMTVEELEKVVREADDLMLPSNLPLSMKELKGVYENG